MRRGVVEGPQVTSRRVVVIDEPVDPSVRVDIVSNNDGKENEISEGETRGAELCVYGGTDVCVVQRPVYLEVGSIQ